MSSVDQPQADGAVEQSRKRNQEPLYLRMFFQSHLTDLVRLFGYNEIPLNEARERLKPLVEKFGREKMEAAAEEIIFIDDAKTPEVARLTDHARKLAVGILGSPMTRRADPISSPTEAPAPPPSADAPVSFPLPGVIDECVPQLCPASPMARG